MNDNKRMRVIGSLSMILVSLCGIIIVTNGDVLFYRHASLDSLSEKLPWLLFASLFYCGVCMGCFILM